MWGRMPSCGGLPTRPKFRPIGKGCGKSLPQVGDSGGPAPTTRHPCEGARHRNGKHAETAENRAATGRNRHPERRTRALVFTPCRTRLGYILERLHIYVAPHILKP